MWFRRELRGPIWALLLLSLGGLLLHIKIHTPKMAFNTIPVMFGVVTTFVLPWMFNRPRLWRWAYVFNIVTVVAGIITMTYFSITIHPVKLTFWDIVFGSTLADNLILLAKIPIGQVIYSYWHGIEEGQS